MNNQLNIFDIIQNRKRFYKTTPLTINETIHVEKMAKGQEDDILQYMSKGGLHTCWTLKERFPDYEMTSIRRALWNLEKKFKKIEQTGFVKGKKNINVGQFKVK